MTQRNKLELAVNQPTEIELLYDEPVTGRSQYGNYFMYAVNSNGQEYTFFAPEEVHSQLKGLSKGDKAVITKLASQRGNKIVTTYDVRTESKEEEPDSPDESGDNFYEIMLQSYRDAIKITSELNGMADPSRIAITLFIARSKISN